jgi:hypothetical protein
VDDLGAIGKTVLSQYVYLSVKVWVKNEVHQAVDVGNYKVETIPLKNPVYSEDVKVSSIPRVVYEDQVKPWYRVLGTTTDIW